MRPAASFKLPLAARDDHDTDWMDAGWTPPRWRPRPSGWARRSTGSSPGGRSMRPIGGCWTTRPANGARCSPSLAQPEVQETNRRAEHAICPAVVYRTAWGGNRSWPGAQTWQVLSSMLATAHPQQRDPVAVLLSLLRAPGPVLADLAVPSTVGVACQRRRC